MPIQGDALSVIFPVDPTSAQSSEDWRNSPFLIRDKKGNIKPNLANCVFALRLAPEFDDWFIMFTFGFPVSRTDYAIIAEWFQRQGIDVTVTTVRQAVPMVGLTSFESLTKPEQDARDRRARKQQQLSGHKLKAAAEVAI